MTRLELSSKTREDLRKSETKRIRREGGIPATVYGKGIESQTIMIESENLAQLLKTPGGRLSLIDLKIDGKGSKAHPVMIQTIQRDPISNQVLHVDFHRVSMNEPVHAQVPITLMGDAPGAKMGGILEQVTRELDVKALPDRIPTRIDVDISALELGESVHVSDVQLGEGVEVVGPTPETIIAVVRMPIVHIEEVAAPAGEEAAAEGAGEAPAAEAGEES